MTKDELDLLFSLKNEYWLEFSKLVNATLAKAPKHLRDHLEPMLQESSSVYGRKAS
jgi:hypothetical protein